jgi:hypothetical protein
VPRASVVQLSIRPNRWMSTRVSHPSSKLIIDTNDGNSARRCALAVQDQGIPSRSINRTKQLAVHAWRQRSCVARIISMFFRFFQERCPDRSRLTFGRSPVMRHLPDSLQPDVRCADDGPVLFGLGGDEGRESDRRTRHNRSTKPRNARPNPRVSEPGIYLGVQASDDCRRCPAWCANAKP